MKWRATLIFLSFLIFGVFAGAQSSTEDRSPRQGTQVRACWTDSATGLMWAAKDNGRDVNWHKALKYCRDLRLAGYSDWRLPTLPELEKIYDKGAEAPGRAGTERGRPFSWHVKGNLFLTGDQWSATQRLDDRGHPSGLAWYFDFNDGTENDDDAGLVTGRFASYGRRALCVRGF